MKRILLIAAATAAACGTALTAAAWASDAPRVATGFIANVICSGTFVSGVNSDRLLSDTIGAMPGVGLIEWAIGTDIDRTKRQVTATLLGGVESRAVYRDGLGCILVHGDGPVDASLPTAGVSRPQLLPDIAGASLVETANPGLNDALDRAFKENDQPPYRQTKAVVIVKNGKIAGERYAPGYTKDTPILGFSVTKSVTSALIGILVRDGRLALDKPAPIAAWSDPGDPRHPITIDQLLRHTSGLAMGSSLNASLLSALDPVNRMKFAERDMAGFAERANIEATPGTLWNYHDGNYLILSRLIRDASGGHAADVLNFARRELFDPLGMHGVTLEFDATGTPEGSSQMLAPARDWAKFGLLYLNDGVIGGKRILPEGWVKYSSTLTPSAWAGMGAGFWTNRGDSKGANYRASLGMPRDAFYASGVMGQYVIVIPSENLVIARFGISGNQYDIAGVSRLVADVIAATGGER
ncbi:MAG: serine hydrolase [Pseudomonadota bacterium]